MQSRDVGVIGTLVRRGEDYTLNAPYGLMRVKYSHWDAGSKGKMQYLVNKKRNEWKTVAYYQDEPQMMAAYYRELENNNVYRR